MYYEIPGGSYEDIVLEEGSITYRCHLPPVGYGKNVVTGELEYIGIEKRSKKKEEQYWELVTEQTLPDWYEELREEDNEEEKQKQNPSYAHPRLQEYRDTQWRHRLCGFWFYNNGIPTYLTGVHWMMLRWWNPFSRAVEYWRIHRQVFYHQLWCWENPNSLGQMLAGPRQFGKSTISGIVVYEPTSRTRKAHSTFQAKNDTDSGLLFDKYVVQPWKELPHFFKPIWDTTSGEHPKEVLRFAHTPSKGRNAIKRKGVELLSRIDHYPANEGALDNATVFVYVSDEFWKLKKWSILKRHYTVRRGGENQGVFRSFFLYTSTAEDEDNGGTEGDAIWEQSKPDMEDITKRTESGLHRLFVEAYQIGPMDKYGETDMNKRRSDIQKAVDDASEGNKAMLKRMDPIKESWMRLVSAKDCEYNADILQEAIENTTGGEWERGNLEWKDGLPDTEVIWKKSATGKWMILKVWKPKDEELNQVTKRGQNFYPASNLGIDLSADPFQKSKTEDNRNSAGSAFARMLPSVMNENPLLNGQPILYYHARPIASVFFEDQILMCHYLGRPMLFENNKDNWEQYFINRGYEAFLVKLPGQVNYGIFCSSTADDGGTLQELWRATNEWVEKYGKYCRLKPLLEQLLKFRLSKTTAYDDAMAFGWNVVQGQRVLFKPKDKKKKTSLNSLIRTYNAA